MKNKEQRPKIKIQKQPIDIAMETIGLIAMLITIVLPAYYYNDLPDTIPSHYNSNGEPDGYSKKVIIWTLPAIAFFMYVGMTVLNRFPHTFNYLQKVTKENAERLYTNSTKMIRYLNTFIICTFAYIVYITIRSAQGIGTGLGKAFTPIFLTLILGTTAYFIAKSLSSK